MMPSERQQETERKFKELQKNSRALFMGFSGGLYSITFTRRTEFDDGAGNLAIIYYVKDDSGKEHEVRLECFVTATNMRRLNRAALAQINFDMADTYAPPELYHLFPGWKWDE
jgi:hypothetical protein